MSVAPLFSEEKHKTEKKKKVDLLNSDHYAGSKYDAVFAQSI